jgi:GntR family transcriptional regulator / MocR family aminotransferase
MTQQLQTSISNAAAVSEPAVTQTLDLSPASRSELVRDSSETSSDVASFALSEPISEGGSLPAYGRLAQEIINQIKSGRLKPGDTLQSTRELAVQLELSRGTVRRAYQELLDRGYTEGKPGSKTVVREIATLVPVDIATQSSSVEAEGSRVLPLSQWRERALQCLSSGGSRSIDGLSEEIEFERLRYAICNYLLRYKGIRCDASQLNIFANRRQALDAIASKLEPNEVVAIDNTTAPIVQKIFTAFGAELRHINTESEGTSINELNALPESCGFFLTTPTDEYLLGSVMPRAERLEILRWARHRSVTILEEASECESQYCPTQIPSLYELSGGMHVNYLYSFGQMLNPLTDVTVIVTSNDCKSPLATKSSRPSLMETAILADLIVDGAIDSFIRRRHRHYRKLRQAAYFETTVALGRFVKISPQKCAHHLVVDFPSQWSTEYILGSAGDAGLSLTLFADYYQNSPEEDLQPGAVNETFSVHPSRFLLNFLCQSPEEIADKIRHFASILTREIAV